MKKLLIAICALILTATQPTSLWAASLTGQIVDSEGQPIENVNIHSSDLNRVFKSDAEGRFEIKTDLKSLSLTFTHIGFKPKTIKVDLSAGSLIVTMRRQVHPMDGLTVTAGRAVAQQSPIAFENLSPDEIDKTYDFGEIPELLENTPNLYSYSDAGGGLGYSYLKIRGFDARRTPVYINGVPLNDPEDHALYFVDLPDFAETVDNIQVQRGVGNSLYADAAFGGSVNMSLSPLARDRQYSAEWGYGSYFSDGNEVGIMRKKSVAYSSGLLNSGWSLSGRWVQQYSDGYRERSWYDGTAYYFSISHLNPGMITTVNIYGGPMRSHAAWDGVYIDMLEVNRRYNPYTYDNETDNFNQPHFELHNIYNFNDQAVLYSTLYFIRGTGYYEQYRAGASPYEYNLSDNEELESDLIRRKQVEKNQYGFNSQLNLSGAGHETSLGLSYYYFESEHWGEVIWVDALEPSYISADHPFKYFEYFGKIHNFSIHGRRVQEIGEKLTLSGDLQLKYMNWDVHQTPYGIYDGHIFDPDWLFLSPHLGATFALRDNWTAFAGFSIASHTPNDDMLHDADDPADQPRLEFDHKENNINYYGDPLVDPERVYDFELGTEYRTARLALGLNIFWMEYRNEIVPDGGLNDDGFPTYGNADRSIHRGIEMSWAWNIMPRLKLSGNYSINDNIIKEYDQIIEADSVIEHRDATIPLFPRYLANFNLEYDFGPGYISGRVRAAGRQNLTYFGRYYDIDDEAVDVSISPFVVTSLKASYNMGHLMGSKLTIEGRVDNIFNEKYKTFGYQWGDYFYYWPAAERSWFVNFKLAVQ